MPDEIEFALEEGYNEPIIRRATTGITPQITQHPQFRHEIFNVYDPGGAIYINYSTEYDAFCAIEIIYKHNSMFEINQCWYKDKKYLAKIKIAFNKIIKLAKKYEITTIIAYPNMFGKEIEKLFEKIGFEKIFEKGDESIMVINL